MLALLLAAGLAGGGELEPCDLTKAERVEAHETRRRFAVRPQAPKLKPEARYPRPACGVWRVQVGPDGGVRGVKLVREGGERNLIHGTEPWVRGFRFQHAPKPWSGLVAVRLNEEQHR